MAWKYINNLANSTLLQATFPQSGHDTSITRTGPPRKSLFPIMQLNTHVQYFKTVKGASQSLDSTSLISKLTVKCDWFSQQETWCVIANTTKGNNVWCKKNFFHWLAFMAKSLWYVLSCLAKWLIIQACSNKQCEKQYRCIAGQNGDQHNISMPYKSETSHKCTKPFKQVKCTCRMNTVSYISMLGRDPCSEDSRITYMDKTWSKVVSSSTRLNNEFPKTAFTAEQLTLN